jgi:hypothetical protein
MARDNVTFKFRIDLTQMTVKGREAIKILEEIERKSGKASASVSRLGAASAKTGQQSAAAAINFQTATQGMLNLSTAAVQTYTSISNLDRANNRAKMSVIAVARAEDLLANKIERQNTLRAAGQMGSQKDINITKEIATAKADLTVKTEKMGIEQAAVNDIYMLFATNIANVTISSMQTIAILDKNSVILNGLKVAGMKIHNALSLGAASAAYKQAAAEAVNTGSKVAATGVTAGLTAAMYGLAAATRAVVAANPLLLAAMAGLTVAWAVHESDILGTKTALDGYLNTEEDHLKLMEEERIAAEGLTTANNDLATSYKKLTPVTKTYMEMMRDAAIQTGNARLAAQYSAQLLGKRPQDFSSPSGGGGFSGTSGGVGVGQQVASTTATGARESGSGDSGFLPSAYADSEPSAAVPAPVDNEKADPFGTVLQQELYKGLNPIEQRDTNIILAAREQNAGRPGASKAYLDKARQLTAAANSYVEPVHVRFEDIMDSTASFFGGAPTTSRGRAVSAAHQEFKFGIDVASREGIDPKTTRGIVLNKTGRDIGMIGNFVDVNEGIRLANLQTTMAGFSNTKGGKAGLAIAAVGGNATQAYQIPEFGISSDRRRQLDIKDSNTNRLRWGGTLRPGMTVWDEGAVTGGYSSARAFSDAGKRKTNQANKWAQDMSDWFSGIGRVSSYTGSSDLRGQLGNIRQNANTISGALSAAGLSYKRFNAKTGLRYRATAWQRYIFNKQWAEVRSYNDNQYAKAQQINILETGGYQLGQYIGSGLSLPSLQDAVAEQDTLMESIGLNRTEAFQIIDTSGRGREEIDDRILWKDRLNNISTGANVL